jgi:phospholipase C
MFVMSPWSRGGWVNSQVFDHTSTLLFLEKRFGVVEPQISAYRRAVCGDLTSAFNFVNPNDAAADAAGRMTKVAPTRWRSRRAPRPPFRARRHARLRPAGPGRRHAAVARAALRTAYHHASERAPGGSRWIRQREHQRRARSSTSTTSCTSTSSRAATWSRPTSR